jgi:hypothetical protein
MALLPRGLPASPLSPKREQSPHNPLSSPACVWVRHKMSNSLTAIACWLDGVDLRTGLLRNTS